MADGDQRVSFIIAGVQKAGTTALFDYLGEDPRLSLSRAKEVHFFDDEAVDWDAPDYGAYHAKFADRPGLRGEATPIYLYWPKALERIAAYRADMKLIVLLRDPVERAWSHWRMETARGVETRDFSWCIRAGRQRLFEGEPWGFDREFSYVERSFYGRQLARLFAVFPRDQVLVLRADHLEAWPQKLLDQISQFLGLAAGPRVEPRRVHVGTEMGQMSAADRDYLTTLYAPDISLLNSLT